jgi:hypothetical protein
MENKNKTTKILILLVAVLLAQTYLASALTITSVTSSPHDIQPGEKFSLDLKVENNLNQDIENVVVSLDLSKTIFAPYQSSNEVRIEGISQDDDEKASFDLIASSDAVSGTYTIPVKITYDLDNGTAVTPEEFIVSATISANPNIGVSSENNILIKGTSGKLTIKIINSGLGGSKFLSISVQQVSGIKITSPNNVYIGNIDSNDFDTADFNIFIDSNAPSSMSVPVKITYLDASNNQVKEDKTISINTYTQKEAISLGLITKNNTFLIIISVVAILVIFLIYKRIRKRNRTKRNGQ